jgi:hypothetical protein
MGLGDAAKAALSKALEALQAIAEVKAIVQQVQLASSSFERRIESKTESLETRIRELERENAKLHAQVQGAYAEALRVVFLERAGHADGTQPLRNGSLPDSSSLSIK